MMEQNSFSNALENNRSILLIAGSIVIAALTVFLLWMVLKPSYEVLMSTENESDMAKATQELTSQNINYEVAENGLNLLVNKEDIVNARKALSELGLPFEDTVGLELFANSDFGVTEFAQKVNYKRALEGELTRTISSLSEVRYARVHLVLPEKKLFDKTANEATAAVTLFLRDGIFLTDQQIQGIQGLVSHSVPMIKKENVTLLDQDGIALNSAASSGIEGMGAQVTLKEKRHHELYIRNKIERLLGAKYSIKDFSVEVDVKLSSVSSKVIEKTLLPLSNGKGALVSARSSSNTSDGEKTDSNSSSNDEQYQYGSRVEEQFDSAGLEKKISVAVLIEKPLDQSEIKNIESLVYAAAGLDKERGDYVAVIGGVQAKPAKETKNNQEVSAINKKTESIKGQLLGLDIPQSWLMIGLGIMALLLCLTLFLIILLVKTRSQLKSDQLTKQQKDALLKQLSGIAEQKV